jgi:hypothetical protein
MEYSLNMEGHVFNKHRKNEKTDFIINIGISWPLAEFNL